VRGHHEGPGVRDGVHQSPDDRDGRDAEPAQVPGEAPAGPWRRRPLYHVTLVHRTKYYCRRVGGINARRVPNAPVVKY